jgi:hypothetical protein
MKNLLLLIVFFLILFFLSSCQPQRADESKLVPVIEKYVSVWNGAAVDSLDSITSENFELRINPKFEVTKGRNILKERVAETRTWFPDFNVVKKDVIFLSDTAAALTWDIIGTYNDPENPSISGKKTEASGFSIIFFNDNILTGEWIGYSDLTWYKGLGYELMLPVKEK